MASTRRRAPDWLYRRLFHENPQSMWVYDYETLSIVDVNQVALEHYGYGREQFLALTVPDLHPPESHSQLLDTVRKVPGKVRRVGIWPQLKSDGTIIQVEITTHEFVHDERRARLVLANDVTEKLAANKALDESRKLLLESQRLARLGHWSRDLRTNQATWSEELYNIFGEDPETCEISFDAFIERVHPDDRARLRLAVQRAQANAEPFEVTYRISRNGQERVIRGQGRLEVDAAGTPVRLFGSAQDITESWRTQQALRESENRFRIVAQVSNDAIWDWDLVEKTIWWSEGFYTLFGYAPEDVQPGIESWYERIHPDDRERVKQSAQRAIADGNTYWSDEYRFLHKDGREIVVHDRGCILHDKQGRPLRMIGGMSDISSARRAEQAIRRINSELEQRVAARTAALEEANHELQAFSYSVSHDLRAPLRAISGFSRMLMEDHADGLNEDARHFLDVIQQSTARMGQLIDDLLLLSRLSRHGMRFETIDMHALARDIVGDFQTEIVARGVHVVVDELPPCEGDERLLRQVWGNLLGNALKYTRKQDAPRIHVGATDDPDYHDNTAYFVADNGVGFDMRYVGKLFDVFQRLHRADEYEGTGVGLAIVKRAVTRHGGRVWALAAPNKGASIHFSLPRLDWRTTTKERERNDD